MYIPIILQLVASEPQRQPFSGGSFSVSIQAVSKATCLFFPPLIYIHTSAPFIRWRCLYANLFMASVLSGMWSGIALINKALVAH